MVWVWLELVRVAMAFMMTSRRKVARQYKQQRWLATDPERTLLGVLRDGGTSVLELAKDEVEEGCRHVPPGMSDLSMITFLARLAIVASTYVCTFGESVARKRSHSLPSTLTPPPKKNTAQETRRWDRDVSTN